MTWIFPPDVDVSDRTQGFSTLPVLFCGRRARPVFKEAGVPEPREAFSNCSTDFRIQVKRLRLRERRFPSRLLPVSMRNSTAQLDAHCHNTDATRKIHSYLRILWIAEPLEWVHIILGLSQFHPCASCAFPLLKMLVRCVDASRLKKGGDQDQSINRNRR